jgi:hypothetical protein
MSIYADAGSEDRPTWHPFAVCPKCREELDVPVKLSITTEGDGAQFIECDPDLTDVWAHAWTHESRVR